MTESRLYSVNRAPIRRFVNIWDGLFLLFLVVSLFFLGQAGQQMAIPYALGQPLPISLDPHHLPFYALRTVLRMFVALGFSLLFTLTVGTLAAKSKRAEGLIIPMIDILQSVPVLSFLAITVTGFIQLFPGSLLGPECAAIFVIFTAQVWNITLSFYQSLKTIPPDFVEVAAMYQLSSWQRFWKIEVPCSLSGLLWNMMMSMSASWFFVVLSESISVAHQNIRLPGIGSYIALAIQQSDLQAIFFAMVAMVIVILIYDQILFRPLIAWSEKFKPDASPDDEPYVSWFLDWLRKSKLAEQFAFLLLVLKDYILHIKWFNHQYKIKSIDPDHSFHFISDMIWYSCVSGAILFFSYEFIQYITPEVHLKQVLHVNWLGLITALRVIILILISSFIWIPIGVWVGGRPHLVQKIQPMIQLAAAFPANLFYPLFVIMIVRYQLNVEIWLTPLMILGTQWYILFNVIAGASRIPRDLSLAAANFGVKGWLWWKKLALPAILPFYITGAITAAGGAWNASIVAEWVRWGDTTLRATGLGEYIQANTVSGHFPQIALGTAMMCVDVLLFNQLLWRPLYRYVQARYQYDKQ